MNHIEINSKINFTTAKNVFDKTYSKTMHINKSFVPVGSDYKENINLKNSKGEPSEEYYKWQFIYSLINSGLYKKDYIGVEIRFPKGCKTSNPIKLDGAIFDNSDWFSHYNEYWKNKIPEDLEWLNNHLIAIIEFKKNEKEVEKIFTGQIKPAMREKEPSDAYVLGIYYDSERLYLFHRQDAKYIRYDESKNLKGKISGTSDLSLHLPDPYYYIPSFDELINRIHLPSKFDLSKRTIKDLDIITSINTIQVRDALSNVLRTLDTAGLVTQGGYKILIQIFALKIFDEKKNQKNEKNFLNFYITNEELNFKKLSDPAIQQFIKRMKNIWNEAQNQYPTILESCSVEWKDSAHVRAVTSVCENFQNFTFALSSKSDLYQLIFYNFANKFQQQEKAQFLTPLHVIDFLVKIVNPRNGETVFDPCCGIGDFLSLSYVNSQTNKNSMKLDDSNIYGADLSKEMITLATLNMLLNGDGNSTQFYVPPDKGSILYKVKIDKPLKIGELLPEFHMAGNWENWPDKTKLMKFHVILTNPPFGEDRAYRIKNQFDQDVINMYETWDLSRGESIDLGVVFLENAYKCLRPEGRMGIVLSNSISSINYWQNVRDWFIERMRLVALFDLPANTFAETGVNTTLIVAYKPKDKDLKNLVKQDYSVFVRDIKKVGYEKRTSKRNVFFKPIYKINEKDFKILTDENGHPILDEEFTQTLKDFKTWIKSQEETLQRLFLEET